MTLKHAPTHCYIRVARVKPSLSPCYTRPWFIVGCSDQEIRVQDGSKVVLVRVDRCKVARTLPFEFMDFDDIDFDLRFTDNDEQPSAENELL